MWFSDQALAYQAEGPGFYPQHVGLGLVNSQLVCTNSISRSCYLATLQNTQHSCWSQVVFFHLEEKPVCFTRLSICSPKSERGVFNMVLLQEILHSHYKTDTTLELEIKKKTYIKQVPQFLSSKSNQCSRKTNKTLTFKESHTQKNFQVPLDIIMTYSTEHNKT